jgi:hypothetical protein
LLVASINTVVRGVDLMPSETDVMSIGKSWMKEYGTTGMAVSRNDKMENESKKWLTHKWNDAKWWME